MAWLFFLGYFFVFALFFADRTSQHSSITKAQGFLQGLLRWLVGVVTVGTPVIAHNMIYLYANSQKGKAKQHQAK